MATGADFMSRGDRGICPDCGGDYQLIKRGLLRRHEMAGRQVCPGSGKPPAKG